MKPKNIALIVGGALLTILCLSLVIWGVITQPEVKLLDACWDQNGAADYIGNCSQREPVIYCQ